MKLLNLCIALTLLSTSVLFAMMQDKKPTPTLKSVLLDELRSTHNKAPSGLSRQTPRSKV